MSYQGAPESRALAARASVHFPSCSIPANIAARTDDAFDHRRVDDLALAGALRLEQPAGDAEREQHPAAAEVADEVERRDRCAARAPDRVEHAGERDVVDVVAGARRERAVLAPAGHAAVDELRIRGEQDVGTEAEALHHARPEAFDERVRLLREQQRGGDAVFRLEIQRHGAAPAQHDIGGALSSESETGIARPVDEQHVGAHVGEHHPAERARPDRLELEHPYAG